MSITVREALKLEGLDKATVVAGRSGLDHVIKRVSVVECPEYEQYPEVVREGDFFLTALCAFRDDAEAQLNMVKTLVECRSSGLCIIDMYMDHVPEVVKEFADEAPYPVMLLPNNVPYGDVITNVMDAIIERKNDTIRAMRLDALLQPGRTERELRQMAYDVNPALKRNLAALFYKDGAGDIMSRVKAFKHEFRNHPGWTVLAYRCGILFILSFNSREKPGMQWQLRELVQRLEALRPDYYLGLSNFHSGRENLHLAVREALLAVDMGEKLAGKRVLRYRDLGLYKLLMLLRDETALRRFHDEIMGPLLEYDEKHNTKLAQTAIVYIENDGNVKRTARAMFQHVNTIRYRLKKMKEILQMTEYEGTFYEQLSVAVKVHKMI